MSDEDLTSLLEQIKKFSGSIPGVEDSEDLSVEELTEEQLTAAHEALAERQQETFQGNMRSRIDEMMNTGGGAQVMADVLSTVSA